MSSAEKIDALDETNKKVLVVLDSGEDVSSADMMALLVRVMERWQRTLTETSGFYREAPGEDGRHVGLGKQLEKERSKSLSTTKARATIAKLSEMLELDEGQTEVVLMYFLHQHYLQLLSSRKKGKAFRFGPDEVDNMTEVFAFYNLERVSSLKAASSVFRMGMDSNHPHQKLAAAAMKKLVSSDIFGKVLSLYHKLANDTLPEKLNENQKTMWVHRNVEEQVACLELLFLVLYSKEAFLPARFVELLTVFEEQAFGVHQLNRPAFECRDARCRGQHWHSFGAHLAHVAEFGEFVAGRD